MPNEAASTTTANSSTSAATPAASTAASATPATQEPSLLTTGAETQKPAVDAAKNADGTNKTPEQIAAEATKNADGTDKTPEQIAAEAKAKEEAAKAQGAPEKYEDFKAPDGITLSPEGVTELQAFAKEHNLPQADAQKLVDMAVKHTQGLAAAQAKGWSETQTQWVESIKADKEIGGANFDTSREFALRAVKQFGSPELQEVMKTGWGNNPAIFKFCVNIGKKCGEDSAVNGAPAKAGANASLAERMYPNQGK